MSFGAFDGERTANSLYTLSLHYVSPFCSQDLMFPLSQNCGVFFFPPSLLFFLFHSACCFVNNTWDAESGERKRESEREQERDENTGRNPQEGWKKRGQKEGGDALKHCCRVEVQDGLMEDRVGRRERTAEDRGLGCFFFFLPPPFNFIFKSVPVSWAQ